jgi:putative hydrolase of the HAD superfamily
MPPRPRLLLFDLDGVLADYDRPGRCAALARAAGADARAMHEAMFGEDGLEHASDRGQIGLQGALEGLRARHGWELDEHAFLDARRLATRVRADMLALCGELASQARLAVFTNNGDWLAEHIARIAPELPRHFGDAIVSSGQLRQWKPEPGAFHACLARLGEAEAAATLFLDDNADNVTGARAAGLDAELFTDIATLRRQLRERGFDLQGESDDAP